jgi:hypothetical protein
MNNNISTSSNLILKNVRLSFPQLFQPKSVMGSEPKYSAAFLLEKSDPQVAATRKAIAAMTTAKWGKVIPRSLKVCLHDGSEKEFDGYEDSFYISANSAKRPLVLDRDRRPLSTDEGIPYAGCFVNGLVRLWAQDNQFGKRVNAELLGVQFVRDGEPFGGGKPATPEDFEDLGADEELIL